MSSSSNAEAAPSAKEAIILKLLTKLEKVTLANGVNCTPGVPKSVRLKTSEASSGDFLRSCECVAPVDRKRCYYLYDKCQFTGDFYRTVFSAP